MSARKFGMHSLYVKNNTRGTSNEISLSVLDAKKQRQDPANASAPENPLGKVRLFSLPGSKKIKGAPMREEGLPLTNGDFARGAAEHDPTGTATLGSNAISGGTRASGFFESLVGSAPKGAKRNGSSSRDLGGEENAVRKRVSKRVGIGVLSCLVIAAAAFGVYALARHYYEDYLTNQSYQQILASSLSAVVEADEVLSEMDASFTDMLGDESLEAMKNVQGKLPTAVQHLDKAEALALRAQAAMSDAKDLKAAQNALDTIAARRSMLATGTALIEETLSVNQTAEQLKEAWDLMLTADASVRAAVASLSPLDSSSVSASSAAAREAQASFESVQKKLQTLMKAHPDIALSSYYDYAGLRAEALSHLVAACSAISDEDVETAAEENALYNDYDMQAAQVASSFVADISTLATDPYFSKVEEYTTRYGQASQVAASSDTALREYLRTTSSK